MTNEELKKKDWQLLMGHSTLANQAMLRTILEYQALILSKIDNRKYEDVVIEMNDRILKYGKEVDDLTKSGVPDYPTVG